ncbi:MAG TPA: hypothetical protein VF748_14590 [Candidatus Acidoferrum sp.]
MKPRKTKRPAPRDRRGKLVPRPEHKARPRATSTDALRKIVAEVEAGGFARALHLPAAPQLSMSRALLPIVDWS